MDKDFEIVIAKAKIVNRVLHLADLMYKKKDIPNRTAATLLYFNLIEWYLDFFVRHISLGVDKQKFINLSLGQKIKLLKTTDLFYKDLLIELLYKINKHRKKIIHNMIDTIFNKEMEKSIDQVKNLFDEFNGIIIIIAKKYGISK